MLKTHDQSPFLLQIYGISILSLNFAAPSSWPDFTFSSWVFGKTSEYSQTSHSLDLISDNKSLERYPADRLQKERDENTYHGFVGPDFSERAKKLPSWSKKKNKKDLTNLSLFLILFYFFCKVQNQTLMSLGQVINKNRSDENFYTLFNVKGNL